MLICPILFGLKQQLPRCISRISYLARQQTTTFPLSVGFDSDQLKILKPFGCIVWGYVDKRTHGRQSKLKAPGTRGCFIGYELSSTYKYWNFARKCFLTSHHLSFNETEFPEPSDFDNIPSALPRPPSPSTVSISSSVSERVVHEQIVVQPPPTVFVDYGPLADNNPLSEAMSHSDYKLWWQAMVNEITTVVQNKTWELAELPPGTKAIPLKRIFKIKRDAKDFFDKYKARIVVRGFSHKLDWISRNICPRRQN